MQILPNPINSWNIFGLKIVSHDRVIFITLGNNYLSGILLKDDLTTQMYYPHIASDSDWWTGIVAYNPSSFSCTITITPYNSSGTSLTAQNLSLDSKEKYIGTVAGLGLPSDTAWFEISATNSITGFELFGTHDGNQLAGYTGVNISNKEGVFSKIEQDGWTGIAFVNIGDSTASILLTAYDDYGNSITTETIGLAGHAKTVDTAPDLFTQDISSATYITYSSDLDVVGFQLNGSTDGMMLDGLPALCSSVGGSIVGSWGKGHYTDSNGEEYLSLTFYPNGYYIHYESDDPSSEDDNGGGVEYGKYAYNSQTGELVVTSLIVNENGDYGLSDHVPGGDCEATVTIDGDTMTFLETCEDGWTETYTFERVKSDSSLIVGSWGPGHNADPSISDYMSLTFYSNGYYIHWESDKPNEPCDCGGGVEYGTYTYDPITEQLTVNPILDENGCIGPSEDGQDTQWQVLANGDTLTFYVDGEEENTFERVVPEEQAEKGATCCYFALLVGSGGWHDEPHITSEYIVSNDVQKVETTLLKSSNWSEKNIHHLITYISLFEK